MLCTNLVDSQIAEEFVLICATTSDFQSIWDILDI
jgi:hypothetical protein